MAAEKFVILRKSSVDSSDPFSPRLETVGGAGAPVDLEVEVAELGKADITNIRRDPSLAAIAPSIEIRLIEPMEASDAPGATTDQNETWGVKAVGATNSAFSGKGISVAVLDTGIDESHPAFSGVQLIQKDFTGEGNGDGNGHGTHCAGTVFGRPVDGLRIGVAPGVERALIGKVLGSSGGGSTEMITAAIQWAAAEGANVISMSLGIDFPGAVERLIQQGLSPKLATSKALEGYRANVRLFESLAQFVRVRMATNGAIMVAASGNESQRNATPPIEITAGPPSAADGIVTVGALGKSGDGSFGIAGFSNTGVNVAAPGVDVLSAKVGGGLRSLNGTSMATPHVAGVAALWAEKLLNETGRIAPDQLLPFLIGRATRTGIASDADSLDVGNGLVQAP